MTHNIALQTRRARRKTVKYVINLNCEKYFVLYETRSRDNSVGIATGYGLNDRGSSPGRSKKYFSTP
jgi:hypothetical protein